MNEFIENENENEDINENVIGKFNFNFVIDFPEKECVDEILQPLCNKMVKKLWELPEIQERFQCFDSFDKSFNMDLVGYGEYFEIEEYFDEEKI